jgi:uncharacterized protein YndB with AHSA1/START domain
MMAATTHEARVVQYEFEVDINAAPSRVWRALTDQLSTWWLPDFHVLGKDSIVTLEPVPGGRLFEQNGDKGLLWYTVLAISTNESLSLAGHCTAEWGGPCSTLLTLKLVDNEKGTRLVVSDSLYGRVEDKQAEALKSGWQQMFDDGLRKFVEAG